ncbi:hypothetical protein ACIHQR_06145 [Corallococcus coralloides]|uniref:hypothetical protein n=1 Tax=Corallococcus coralloides TaxID=184914 RepID=UPI0038509DF7
MEDPSTEATPQLGYIDIKPILARLGDLATSKLVLVGGQAVNFWVDYYRRQGRLVGLGDEAPLTSKDIDFCADREDVARCAVRLNGKYRLPTIDDHTPSVGLVTFLDDQGIERVIDFIDSPYGLKAAEVHRTAQQIDLFDGEDQPTGESFLVMHPVWCMKSRVSNTMELPGYATPHALRQLRASVACAREFLFDLLEAGEYRAVFKLNEQIFSFCHWTDAGRMVQLVHGVDPFDAVVVDPRLPESFLQHRYPQMVDWLKARRERAAVRLRRPQLRK